MGKMLQLTIDWVGWMFGDDAGNLGVETYEFGQITTATYPAFIHTQKLV